MSTIDLSRLATDPRKHYAGVRMQQGRVLTDDDFNEAAALDAEDMRRTRVHTIGAYGSPDAGFLPKDFAVVGGKLDFKLGAGTLYLGGLRLEMHAEEHYLLQKDWLNFDPATQAQDAPAAGATRTDLVWIEAWQQPVTAVEDSELFEVALGGPDTSTRWRTLRRVHVAPGVPQADCAGAWAALAAGFAPTLGNINAEMELVSGATLSVSFSVPASSADLCAPPQPGGYLGAENQAIRVQMVDATHYTWGFDNAAPLYRAQVGVKGGQLVKLTLLNLPKDAVHWPLKGQVVEVLPWSAALANGERIAEPGGHLCKVLASYNPDDHTLEIDAPVPAAFAQWKTRADKAEFFDGSAVEDFVWLRVWNRGDDLASPAAIPVASADLGHTGLRVAFAGGPLRPNDYWVIAARPAAPDVVLPWQLSLPAGAPPNGIRRYRAPLALIEWKTVAGQTTGSVLHDCRPPFLPLTRIRNCCSVSVGDGIQSFGTFTSIQAALDALPASGGTVCILPGRYQESVKVLKRHNVTLHGCGPRSRIVGAANTAALLVTDSSDIAIESLAIEGGPAAVVEVRHSTAVRLASCLVQVRDRRAGFSPWPAVFVDGTAVEVEDNIIEPLPADLERIFHQLAAGQRAQAALAARGGIQLAGGCQQVRIAGNVIAGGAGNGITLGSILRIDDAHPDGQDVPDIDIDDPCAPCDPTDDGVPPDDPANPVRFRSGGDLYDIDIDDNLIVRHGANGIAAVRFFSLPTAADGSLVLVTVHRLSIACNRIVGCLQRDVAQAPAASQLLLGYGGISLAFATELEIESNLITGNGRNWLTPVCGVFVLAAEGLRIEHNRINANGLRNGEPPDSAQPGVRAGVHVWLALSTPLAAAAAPTIAAAASVRPAGNGRQLRVHGNQVAQPLGRALFLLGAGPMAITDNLLVSEGAGARVTDPVASTVLIGNAGFSREWTNDLLMVLYLLVYVRLYIPSGRQGPYLQRVCDLSKRAMASPGVWPRLPTGKLTFSDNQVSFLMADAARALGLSSVLLLSLDDVGACDNQFEYHAQNRAVLADLLAVGFTVRTSDNRLAETWGRAARSLLSAALLNTAADNQSTHCITALGLQRAMHHNLVLAQAFCADACGNEGSTVAGMLRAAAMARTS